MIKFSKKQLLMSLFVLATNTISSNSFASDETEREFDYYSSIVTNTETRTLSFKDIFENGDNVERNDTINILDVDFKDETKNNFLYKTLENKNNLVKLIITKDSPFLYNGVLSMNWNAPPNNLKHLSIIDRNNFVEKIGSDFLSYCYNLISFDSTGLENVTQIGPFFLSGCENLIYFDARGLKNVKEIGDLFLSNCESLIYFDARRLWNVKQIGEYFLSDCALKEIIITSAKQWFWKENISNNIKELINKNSIVFLIQNENQYNDIEERVDYVKEHYAQEIGGLTFLTPWRIKIKTNSLLLL